MVHSFEGTVHYSGEGIEAEVVGSWSHCIQDQEAEINLVLSSLPLTQSGILPHGMVQLAQSRNSITEKPRGLSVFWVILGPIRFTVDCNPRDGKGSQYPRPSNVQRNQQSLGIWGCRGMGSKD